MNRFEFYQRLEDRRAAIVQRFKQIPREVGMPADLEHQLGLLGGSNLHAPPRDSVLEAAKDASGKLVSSKNKAVILRKMIKEYYGDEWDAVMTSTGEAALHLVIDALMTPSISGRGGHYRARYVAPYERHIHHQAGYGRPFPPRYKDLVAERGVSSGEAGLLGKHLADLDVVLVRLAGARYENHGIRQFTCPLLSGTDAEESIRRLRTAAERHAPYLSGFTSIGYDTPGYGYGEHTEEGVPRLMRYIGELATDYDVPYLVDNARGTPFLGNDPRKIQADLMIYSTDKAFNGPTGGLIIGREEPMVQVRRMMGLHGMRYGTLESYGKAVYVGFDPGKEALAGTIRALELLLENPESFTQPVDTLHEIAQAEMKAALPEKVFEGMAISKSYNSLAVEIDYTGTWSNGELGLPIFSIEDMYAGSNLVQGALPAMNMLPGMLGYDGNIVMAPGMGTTDKDGNLIVENATLAVRCLARALAVLYEEAHRN